MLLNFCIIPAVVSSQDGYQQQVLSELDQYLSTHYEDEFINSGIVL